MKTKMPAHDLDEELQAKIDELWRLVKPSTAAQKIRGRLSVSFDSEKSEGQWLGDHAPEYVWDLVDIAAQWGIDHGLSQLAEATRQED